MIHEAPRSRRRRANQARILDAAVEIASVHGLAELSIKRVADAADYTPGALYRYYPSKDALLTAVAAHVIERLGERLQAVALRVSDPLESVVAQAMDYRRFSREEPHAFALIASMLAEPRVLIVDPGDALRVGAAMHAALTPLAQALSQAAERGQLSDEPGDAAPTSTSQDASEGRPRRSAERALVLFVGVQGALQVRKQERVLPELVNADRIARQIVRAILAGWGAEPALLTRCLAADVAADPPTPSKETTP